MDELQKAMKTMRRADYHAKIKSINQCKYTIWTSQILKNSMI
jgi:hypothetical protein